MHFKTNHFMKSTLFFFILFSITLTRAQTTLVEGVVTDYDTGKPVEFCNVLLENSTIGTLSDETGRFRISIPADRVNDRIVFKTLGYETKFVRILQEKSVITVRLKQETASLDEIVISGTTRATAVRENPVSITAVTPRQMEKTAESNIIDALVKNVPGLQAVKTGPNISKPFIHGLGYNRVLTLYDGVRQEGQQYGDEHGIEIDEYNIERAEVIKGPASLLYGSDAIAGVISLYPYIPKTKDGKLHGKVTGEYQTNNNLIGNGIRLNYDDERFLFALNGSYRMAKNYRNSIDGRVYATNYNIKNISAMGGIRSDKGFTHLSLTAFDNRQAIPDGSRDSISRQFTKQIFEDDDDLWDRPVVSSRELNSYKIPDLSQHIQHYRAYLHSFYEIGAGDIDILLGVQQSVRREYSHPEAVRQPGMYMRLNTLNYGIRYNVPAFHGFETALGVNGMLQNNKNKDATDFPIPDYDLYEGGFYIYEKWKRKQWTISGGIRYDLRRVAWNDFFIATDSESGFDRQSTPENPDAELQFEAFKNTYYGLSGSIGTTYKMSENIGLKANIGRAYRAPNVTEIGSNGLDPGAHIIYLGDRSFLPEFSLQEDFGVHINYRDVSGTLNLFHNQIQNFIYMSAVADAFGNPITDAQGNRTYRYEQAKASLYGGEMWFALHPSHLKGFRWDVSLSTVYGFNRKSEYRGKGIQGEYLPLLPPFTINSSITQEYHPDLGRIVAVSPKVELEYAAQQNRYLGLNGTETATPSYALLNIGFTAEIDAFQNPLQVVIQANNVFDTAYQSHLNRLKYFEYYTQSPNNRFGIYNMGRNITLKLIAKF